MKKMIAMVLCLVLALSIVGCGKNDTKTFEITGAEKLTVMSGETGKSIEITNANDIKYITGAEKLTVMSGKTGKSIEITNANDIKYITDNINALKYSKGEKVNSDGWSYALQWIDKDGKTIDSLSLLGDGYTVISDGYYYKGMLVDYEIDLEFLENQFAD